MAFYLSFLGATYLSRQVGKKEQVRMVDYLFADS